MTSPLDLVLRAIADRQPLSATDVTFGVENLGRSLSVDCAYRQSGGIVNKHYHVTVSPPHINIRLDDFQIRFE